MGIIIERQAPERGERAASEAPAGHCCCCCCCCLHAVGSVAGALSARPAPVEPDAIPPATTTGPMLPRRHSAGGLYWSLVLVGAAILGGWFYTTESTDRIAAAGLVIAMALPLIQLAASAVVLVAILASGRPGKDLRLRHLGKITLRGFLGGLVGVLIMLPMFAAC